MKKTEKDEEKLREVPKANYAKLSTILIITVVAVVFAFMLYRSHKEYQNQIPVIRGASGVAEIEPKELEAYFTENDDFLLYIGVASDENCREVEEDLIELLKTRKLPNLIYLNISDVTDKIAFYQEFNQKYSDNRKVNYYPAFVIVSNQKVLDLVERKENGKLRIDDIEKLLDEYEISGEIK